MFLFIAYPFQENIKNDMYGNWVFEQSFEDELIYKKVGKLRKGKSGFAIQSDGKAIIQTNSFGCAVISKRGKTKQFIDRIEGEWKKVNDTTILLSYETFNGQIEKKIFLENGKLISKSM